MAVEVVTVINTSGKVISNGKHLLNLWKEAKATYQEKKAAIKAELAVKRSYTYDVPAPRQYEGIEYVAPKRAATFNDARSHASSHRSHHSYLSRSSRHRSHSQSRLPLTASNLQTLTEISSTAPSRPPVAYRSPYAETLPMQTNTTAVTTHHRSIFMHRAKSVSFIGKKSKDPDMDLAYGNVPPDLASRADLDPACRGIAADDGEAKAKNLTEKIEGLLAEAQCVQETADHMITHLQENPDAAAAVALTLAELSAVVGKLSPAILTAIKAGSPAVFALLASPQFLIAAGVAVGVTIVMFGGWKIIKRIKDGVTQPMAYEATAQHSGGVDEAVVLEEELSTIETWRRGIPPFGENEKADAELISPEALRSQYGDDAKTVRSGRSAWTRKTHKSPKSHKGKKEIHGEDVPERKSSKNFDDHRSVVSSHRSHKTHPSSKSKSTVKSRVRAIEGDEKDKENSIDMVIRPKKDNMLKTLFKKKKITDEKRMMRSSLVLA